MAALECSAHKRRCLLDISLGIMDEGHFLRGNARTDEPVSQIVIALKLLPPLGNAIWVPRNAAVR